MPAFSDISIIYNPNSTGDGKSIATKFMKLLTKQVPSEIVDLVPTEHAGHAEELAYELARTSLRPLIISASGDGGYHEVVNGIVRANSEGAHAVTGLLPAGNANDHHRELHNGNIVPAVVAGTTKKIDLIRMDAVVHGEPHTEYAHSYIGFGLTTHAGNELNKVDLNWINQAWIVAKSLFVFEPVKVAIDDEEHIYDSLIFSNVGKMSKFFSVANHASPSDGKFEVTTFRRLHKLRLLMHLIRASTGGISEPSSVTEFHFTALKQMLVQADGEVAEVDTNSPVDITIAPKALECIV